MKSPRPIKVGGLGFAPSEDVTYRDAHQGARKDS